MAVRPWTKWSHPITSWALIAVFSNNFSGIGLIFRSCGWLILMDVGILPLVGCMECVAWWVPLFLLSSDLFLVLTCLFVRLRFHCSGIVVPLSPSLESWCMMVVVGVTIVISPPLSCIELEVVLVVLFFWIVRSWWNSSIRLGLEFYFDAMLARSKYSSSDSDEVTSRLDISLRRGFDCFDALNWPEVDTSSVELGMLFWSIILRLPCLLIVLSSESLLESLLWFSSKSTLFVSLIGLIVVMYSV